MNFPVFSSRFTLRLRFGLAFVIAAIAVASGAIVSSTAWAADAGKPPNRPANVLVLLSDDHCYRALGCAGDPAIKTPNLDRLAEQGVRFTHCFTPMPQCSPSRAALLTGQDCWTNGVRTGNMPFAKHAVLWPQLLDRAGYETFYTGKWHNVGMPWEWGFNRGANIYHGGMSDHRHLPLIQWKQSKENRQNAQDFSTTVFVDTAIDFLKQRDRDKPFCAYVSFTAPHDPWVPPGEYATMYDPAAMPVPPNLMARPPFKVPDSFTELRDQQVLPFPRTEADVRRGMALYYGMISQLDSQIGRLLKTLDEQHLTEHTLVIFAGDHGHSLGSHGFVGKQCMYEEGIRLPLIVRYPPVKRGPATCDELVSLVDFFPTICQVAGIEPPAGVEGQSLLPLYAGREPTVREQVFASHHSPGKHGMSTCCVRTKQHKLIQHLTTGENELFDLENDPFELTNLTGKPQVAEIQSKLTAKLKEWRSTRIDRASNNPERNTE